MLDDFLKSRIKKEFVVTTELDPPLGADPEPTFRQAIEARPYVHAVNISDSPMANLRMSPIALSYLVQAHANLETIFHLTTRDRNILGLQSELLGAAALGIHNILALTGDHPKRGDHPNVEPVFEVDVLGLIDIANTLNKGKSKGRDLKKQTQFTIFAAANPTAGNMEIEKSKIRAKIKNGVNIFQTQPIFSIHDYDDFAGSFGHELPAPFLFGILPIRSLRMAKNVAKWANVPPELIKAVEKDGAKAGLLWSKELIEDLRIRKATGVHIYTLGKTSILKNLLPRLSRPSLSKGKKLKQ